jgi:hypothetical protein
MSDLKSAAVALYFRQCRAVVFGEWQWLEKFKFKKVRQSTIDGPSNWGREDLLSQAAFTNGLCEWLASNPISRSDSHS